MQSHRELRLGWVVRDVSIIFILTFLGGLVVRIASGGLRQAPEQVQLATAASNFFFGIVGFTIAGCLASANRWRHLRAVAVGAWFAGLVNVAFFGVSFLRWLGGILVILVIMSVGGAISFVFKRDSRPSP